MKKAVLLIAALVVVSSMVFAAEPVAELKITEFTGDASVTLGVDLGTTSIAFANTANADIKIELCGTGDKSTTGDNIWGELKIKTDGDPVGIKLTGTKLSDYTGVNPAPAGKTVLPDGVFYGYKVVVDVAKLHFGSLAYLGITSGGTDIDYATLPYEGAAVYKIDTAQRYGTRLAGDPTVLADVSENTGAKAEQGIVFGISVPNIVNVDVDFRSFNTWGNTTADLTTALKNRFGLRGAIDVTAVPNLTVKAAAGTGFGGEGQLYDIAFGGKVSYKYMLDDKMFIMPLAAVNAVLDKCADAAGTGTTAGTDKLGYKANAGAVFGWGDRTKLNLYFSPDKDIDPSGYYPGIAAGVQVTSQDVFRDPLKMRMGLNVSAFSGSIVENLSANAALEIDNLLAEKATEEMNMGFVANLKYDVKMDPMTISPKFGIYFLSTTPSDLLPQTDEEKTDVYVKAGVDIAKIFPNTTLSFEYMSNDFVGGLGDLASSAQTDAQKPLGAITTTLKIAF